MRNEIAPVAALLGLAGAWLAFVSRAPQPPVSAAVVDWSQYRIVDLTYSFNAQTPFWPGEQYAPFKLETIATLEKDGVYSKAMSLPEHLGTHIDAPNHFEKHPVSTDRIAIAELFATGVVVDFSAQAELDADATLSLHDIRVWEARHGVVPEGAVVFLHTGWGRYWTSYARYKNQDAQGRLHFPGYSAEAARYLIQDRKAKGLGIDTLSIDPGNSRDFPVHHIVNAAGKYGLENVAGLAELPPTGFQIIVAPMKIEDGTGGPTRIFALVPK